MRDAKTYAELRRILDRNGKYLSRQGRRHTTRDYFEQEDDADDGDGCWGVGDGQRAKLSLGWQCDTGTLRAEGGVARRFANYYQHEGIQWHLDYLDACIERGEEVKRRFIEKQFTKGRGSKTKVAPVFSSVFNVQQPNSEVLVGSRRRVFRSSIMDSFPSKLNHEKSEKLQNLIDNLYQLKLDGAELENDALPKIILTDCSASSAKNAAGDKSKLASSCKLSIDDNRLNNNSLKLGNNLGVPASSLYQSEARPP